MKKSNILKSKKRIAALIGASILTIAIGFGINSKIETEPVFNQTNDSNFKEVELNDSNNNVEDVFYDKKPNEEKEMFYALKYAKENYLAVNEEYLKQLIKQAIVEVEKEYVSNGATPCFAVGDKVYSYIDEDLIASLMFTESSYRLIKLKDVKDIFNVENYEIFYGKDAKGTIYYGLGMMSENALEYLVDVDRKTVNKFKDYSHISIDAKSVELTFDNLNPYLYLQKTNAKSKDEIIKSLSENIKLSAKCIYSLLNRFVKDYTKEGKHDKEFAQIKDYTQLSKYSDDEIRIWFALLSYNQGGPKTMENVKTGMLFEKDNNGYVNNIKYPEQVLKRVIENNNVRYNDEGGLKY